MIVGEDFGKEINDIVLMEGNIILELQQTSHQHQTSRKRTSKYLLTDRHQILCNMLKHTKCYFLSSS
jgi:hypothetical protein